jgi:regulatory protein YycH of two-component signal transduction system YycFG
MLLYAISIVAVAYLIWYFFLQTEKFSNKEEKETQIKNWFATNPQGVYRDFKRAFPRADIVDFEKGRSGV